MAGLAGQLVAVRDRRRLKLLVGGWVLSLAVTGCTEAAHGPWVDADGRVVQSSEILEYQGLNRCDQQSVTFLRVYQRQYAKDPEGVLGVLRSQVSESVLTFEATSETPPGIEPTGFRHEEREIYLDADTIEDYLYLVYDSGAVERWPRAEGTCN